MKENTMAIKIEGNISVNSIQRNCGIFIGEKNSAVGWSAHGKSNNVFNSIGDSNLLVQNLCLVIDPDFIDTPIDDRDQHIIFDTPEHDIQKTNIDIQAININAMIQNSGVFAGHTAITGMESHEKANTATGDTYGEKNLSIGNASLNYDPDLVDTIINDQDFKPAFIHQP